MLSRCPTLTFFVDHLENSGSVEYIPPEWFCDQCEKGRLPHSNEVRVRGYSCNTSQLTLKDVEFLKQLAFGGDIEAIAVLGEWMASNGHPQSVLNKTIARQTAVTIINAEDPSEWAIGQFSRYRRYVDLSPRDSRAADTIILRAARRGNVSAMKALFLGCISIPGEERFKYIRLLMNSEDPACRSVIAVVLASAGQPGDPVWKAIQAACREGVEENYLVQGVVDRFLRGVGSDRDPDSARAVQLMEVVGITARKLIGEAAIGKIG
jgi:hypothetical protein